MLTLPELRTDFTSREEKASYLQKITGWLDDNTISPIEGTTEAMRKQLAVMDALHYGKTRNFLDGKVTRLSPYIRHGMLTLSEVRDAALAQCTQPEQIEKFLQELAWRDFWQQLYRQRPECIWQDIEPYKTGWQSEDYADELPTDIAEGRTGIACLDQFIHTLLTTGYMHNHTRMYVASYIVHWRRVKWQAGAKWFLHHLLDGDPASNNLSWQWIASTFSNKPYIFNLENVQKYASADINTSAEDNAPLHASYEELGKRLFPNNHNNL